MVGTAQIEVLAAITVPAFAFGLNWSVRSRNGYALSAAADFVLAIAAFDLIALIYSGTFEEVVRNEVFRHSFIRLIVVLFSVTFFAWFTVFLSLEHKMSEGYDFDLNAYIGERPMGPFLLGWGLLAAFFGMHIFTFLYE